MISKLQQIYVFSLLLTMILGSCGTEKTKKKKADPGPGPCYDLSLAYYLEDEFRVLPEFSSKGESVLKKIEEETGLEKVYWIGHYDNDSLKMTCRTLDIVFQTTDFNSYVKLDTSGRMDQIMELVFETYLNECKNSAAYETVMMRFIVGKDDSYEDFVTEQSYYLSVYKKIREL